MTTPPPLTAPGAVYIAMKGDVLRYERIRRTLRTFGGAARTSGLRRVPTITRITAQVGTTDGSPAE